MVRRIILALIILVFVVIAYNLTSQIFNTLKSGDRVSEASERLAQLEAKNKDLRNKLVQVNSGEFIEEEARNKLGLTKEGETLVIIPDEKINLILEGSRSAQEIRFPNPIGWWKVFF